jgi:uncharacterized protein (TIGR02757 family)
MQSLKIEELKDFLDENVEKYNQPNFIENDPIQIPHQFSRKEDIEISAFLTSTIAWGRRDLIIKSANRMMALMDNDPYDFVLHCENDDMKRLEQFVHRTFNGFDFTFFIKTLKRIYKDNGGLEEVFYKGLNQNEDIDMKNSIGYFNSIFFEDCDDKFRTRKHVANPLKGSAAKRLVMFLRWMVRRDNKRVDFGLWNKIPMTHLSCPLDVHTGNVGRSLGLITRKQNDWQTVQELDAAFRKLDPSDPSKYDFALFGLGAMDGWK